MSALTASRAPKACQRCKRFDPACGFWRRYRNADGYDSYCVECARFYHGRRVDAARGLGEHPGGYHEPPEPEFYCRQCDLELSTADGLAHHRELRHEER